MSCLAKNGRPKMARAPQGEGLRIVDLSISTAKLTTWCSSSVHFLRSPESAKIAVPLNSGAFADPNLGLAGSRVPWSVMGVVRSAFDPAAHRRELVSIIREIERLQKEQKEAGVGAGSDWASDSDSGVGALGARALNQILRRFPRDGRGFFSRSQLIAGFRAFSASEGFGVTEREFVELVRLRPVRTQSGVAPVAVFTAPFPCPGVCIFCPDDSRMPKSYLSDEPGAQRAADNGFDPYLQTWNRLAALHAIGHPTEKVELIISGGTWSHYPRPYQIWFVARCFEALNDFGRGVDGRAEVDRRAEVERDAESAYKRALSRPGAAADWDWLSSAQRDNETASCRNVGLVVETRPDRVTESELVQIRRLGCTKVQIGCQSLSDAVLSANRRGHTVAASSEAIGLLRRAGFKIQVHWMPNLLGSSPELDKRDFERLFGDTGFRPDEVKIYPCSLIRNTELVGHHSAGDWKAYGRDELLQVLEHALANTPRYCRISRMIRDISSQDILAGNTHSNLREVAEEALQRGGGNLEEIRSREIRGRRFDPDALRLCASDYATAIGQEHFFEFTTAGDRLVGFLRLALPRGEGFVPEISHSALIREVHVYGATLDLSIRDRRKAQHRGLGQALVSAAIQRARAAGYRDVAVISAVGTRNYYRSLGFQDGPLYQHYALR